MLVRVKGLTDRGKEVIREHYNKSRKLKVITGRFFTHNLNDVGDMEIVFKNSFYALHMRMEDFTNRLAEELSKEGLRAETDYSIEVLE